MTDCDIDREQSPSHRSSPSPTPSQEITMNRSSSRIQEAEGAMDGVTCPNSVPRSTTKVTSPQNAPSATLHSASAIHLTISPQFTPAVPLRKYRVRVNKESHTTVTSWQQDGESLLDQVVEQERQAWLTESPRPSDLEQTHGDTSSRPTDSSDHEDHNAVDVTQADDPNLSREAQLQRSRRSLFVEGSMNEGSKAIASTWHKTEAFPVVAPDADSDNESESTPRSSLAGSRRSSIDINEFKPLPATPLTFKATIKAFGQKLKQRDSGCSSPVRRSIPSSPEKERKQPEQQRRRGLRKSVTSWKIFNNSMSDAESGTTTDADDGDDNSVKTDTTARTLRSIISKPRAKLDSPQKAMLNDRKRKAEIAYAERFGTANKKQKQNAVPPDSSFASAFSTEPTTVRMRGSSRPAMVNTNQSTVRRISQSSDVKSHSSSRAQLPAPMVEPSASEQLASEPLPRISHPHSSSQSSAQGSNSVIDGFKRTSRSKLEKENQQLRGLLRESTLAHVRRSASQSGKASGARSIHSENDEGSGGFGPSSNWHIHEDSCSSATETQARGRTKSARRSGSRSPTQTPKPSTDRMDENKGRVSPSAPPLPETQPARSALSPVGNAQPAYSAATTKRCGVTSRPPHVIELPRPLSMVLEGVEDDSERKTGKDACDENKVSSSKRKIRSSYGGMADGEDGEQEQKFVTMVSRSGARGIKGTQWQWPDDVF